MTVNVIVVNIKESLLDLIFPAHCSGCGRMGNYLCQCCWDQVEFFHTDLNLLSEANDCYLDQIKALTRYQFPINKLIIDLKYHSVKPIGKLLAKILYSCANPKQFDLVTTVPTSHKRLKQRGFNQAEIIALEFARLCNKPYLALLTRVKDPGRQKTSTNRRERSQKQTDCFGPAPGLLKLTDKQKKIRILLIDDVVTTAATANECAKVLKRYQADQVYLLTTASDNNGI